MTGSGGSTLRKICISGFASLSRGWVNEQEEDVEVWAMNEAHIYLKRPAHYWFQLHPRNWNAASSRDRGWPEDCYGRHPAHLEYLIKAECPVYMQETDDRVPNSVRYPYEEIVERYGFVWLGGEKRPYLTSTAAFMLALALKEHDDGHKIGEVRLAGVELAVGTEYFHQRACVEFWLGMLRGRGAEIIQSPYGTSILNGTIYGREHIDPLYPQSMQTFGFQQMSPATMPIVAVMEDEAGNPVGL